MRIHGPPACATQPYILAILQKHYARWMCSRIPTGRAVDDELSKCPECGRYRGPDGQLLGGNDREGHFDGQFKAIYLCDEDEDE